MSSGRNTEDRRGLVAHSGVNASAHVLARVGEQCTVYRGGEDSGLDALGQIHTGWGYNLAPGSLSEGQQMRMQEIQEANIIEYEQEVFRNRRSINDFDLE